MRPRLSSINNLLDARDSVHLPAAARFCVAPVLESPDEFTFRSIVSGSPLKAIDLSSDHP